jgi:exodeoxyribonuclease VII small subunit
MFAVYPRPLFAPGLSRQFPPFMPKTEKPEKAQTYESALSELEGIVSRMEDGQLTLEQSLTAYKRGAELLKFCQAQLADAQQQVKVLEAGVLKNFAGDDDDEHT